MASLAVAMTITVYRLLIGTDRIDWPGACMTHQCWLSRCKSLFWR